MTSLLRLLFDISLLRAAPQDLPYSVSLTRALVIAELAIEALYATFVGATALLVPRLALSLAVLLFVPWALLAWRGRPERFVQTLGALTGTGVLFTLALLPAALAIGELPEPAANGEVPTLTPQQMLLGWLTLVLLGWKLVVNGHIFRHALDVRLSYGIAAAVVMLVVQVVTAQLLLAGVR